MILNFKESLPYQTELLKKFKVREGEEFSEFSHQFANIFKEKLKEEIAYTLSLYLEDDDDDTLDIAIVQFAYQNQKILTLLKQRGNLLSKLTDKSKLKL